MTPVIIANVIVNNLTGFAIGRATSNLMHSLVPATSKYAVLRFATKASVYVTSFAVSGIIHDHVRRHTTEKIDGAKAWFDKTIASIK